jgi:hypothetical protein
MFKQFRVIGPISRLLTGIVNYIVFFRIGHYQWHQVTAGKIILAHSKERWAFDGVIESKEALEILKASCTNGMLDVWMS